jgi:hypothetical protein
MRVWNDEAQWVSDEDGVRWYFSERDPGGPSRLECYRRLLGEAGDWEQRGYLASIFFAYDATLRRLVDLLDLVKQNWRGQPIIPA